MAYKIALENFSSIHSLIAQGDKRPNNKAFQGRTRDSDTGSESFAGTKSYDEAKDLLQHGWDEPLAKIKESVGRKKVSSNTQADRRRPSTGIVGYQPCVPNAILGLPNSMICTETVKQKVKAVTIVYCSVVHAGWSTEEIVDCGVTVMKIIDMLELQGLRVKLAIEGMSTICGNDLSILRVDVKDWKEQIDLKKIAFPVVNPSMLRRIGFRWLETCPQITNTSYPSGYGKPLGNTDYPEVVRILKEGGALGENEYYINAQLCKDKKQDIDEILKAAGMSALKIKEERKGA